MLSGSLVPVLLSMPHGGRYGLSGCEPGRRSLDRIIHEKIGLG